VSKNRRIRSEHLRKVSCLILAVCLLNIGWSWPFFKDRTTDNAQRSTKKEESLPSVETKSNSRDEVKAPSRPVAAEVTVLEVSRTEDSLANMTRSVSVIDQEEIKNSTAKYVPELLKSKAGIVVTDTTGNPKGMTVDIRGFGDTANRNVLVLVDGRRTNPMDISGPDWGAIPLETVERVEVIRGPSSVLYGDNAAGGVINIVTKKAKSGIHAKAETEIGLHQYKRTGATVSGANDWADGLFHYENTQDDGWRNNTQYWANDWFGKFGVGPFYGAGIDFSAGHHRDRYGLAGDLSVNEMGSIGRRGSTTSKDHAWSQNTYFTADPEWKFELGDDAFVISGFNSFQRRLSKADYVSLGSSAQNNLDSYEFQPKVSWSRPLTDWLTSKLTTGLDFFTGTNDIKNVNPAAGIWSFWKYATVTKKALDVYILENLSAWDKLLLNMGFRGGWAKYSFDQTGDTTNFDTASMRNAAFDFGVGYKILERSLAYFDVSRSFRMPATDEFYSTFGSGLNAGLKQQQEMDYEIGLRDNTFKPLSVAGNFFLADIKDEIFYDPRAGGGMGANVNYKSPTRRYGFEMESSLKLFEKRWFNIAPFFNLTTQRVYFKGGDYSDKRVPLVPDFKYATGFVLAPVKGLTISTELNHLGHQFAINDQANNLPKLKAYTVVDMKVRYNWRWATAWISLTNLFNKKYSEYSVDNYGGGTDYYPAQGRNVVTGFSLEY
jgi:iron complex outermembrane receptor protein